MSEGLPEDVRRLLEQRKAARERRDWPRADELREQIRGLGWEPVDGSEGSTARPMLPDDASGPIAYASPDDLASLIDQPAELDASLVVAVDDHPADLLRLADGLRAHPPSPSWELLVVVNNVAEGVDLDRILADLPAVRLRTSARLGWADAANLGLRRARGGVIVLLDTSLEPVGDFLPPLLAAFEAPEVGVAGPWGVTSADGRQFLEAAPGEVDAVEAYCLAIRREALRAVGGIDHRFRFYRNADLDLSFAVRDAGWRALSTGEPALRRHLHRGWASLPDDERDRQSRRNFYRFLKRWGDRPDLLLATRGERPGPAGTA